ncbi:MAG: hypothetical protein MUE53_02745 [Chitinophagales bacterium]|jgi:hypothetical protein|nr:hypothetical protein [Chitinophagales bacterium]
MEFLKDLGIVGFWFFLIKGILWLILFGCLYFGFIDSEKFSKIQDKMSFFKRKPKNDKHTNL